MSQDMGPATSTSLLFLALYLGSAFTCIPGKNYGDLYPRDSNYLVGSNVTLKCNLTKLTENVYNKDVVFNSSLIRFKHEKVEFNVTDIEVLSPLEATYTIVNGQPEDSGNYYCMYQLPEKQFLICPTILGFGYPPAEVQNFTCRSIDWQRLDCTWKIPPNSAPVRYKLSYTTTGSKNLLFQCPWKTARPGFCRWTLQSTPLYIKNADTLTFYIEGDNGLGVVEQEFRFKHYEIVIPGPPENLKMAIAGSDSIFLTWESPKDMRPIMFTAGVCYRILYKAPYEDDFTTKEIGRSEGNFTLFDLFANTWYTVRVQGRSCVAPNNEEMWGPSAEISGKTKSDIPAFPPEAPSTSFDAVTYKESRSITIYWKPVSKKFQNGDGFRYLVMATPYFLDDRRRRENSRMMEKNVSIPQAFFNNLEVDSAYEFRIRTFNERGLSINVTRIVVPKLSDMPNRPSYIQPVSMGGGKYRVAWQPAQGPVNVVVGGYTLFWCRVDQTTSRCESDLDWVDVPADTHHKVLLLNDKINYDFGVAAYSAQNKLGSGLEWASCTVQGDRAVERLRGVSTRAESPREIRVSWKLACEAQKAVVQQYAIYLCKSGCFGSNTCMGSDPHMLVNNSQAESALLNGLQPYTQYGVTVVVISVGGRSEESSRSCVTTPYEAPSDAPHKVSLSNVTNHSVVITWHPPVHPNGEISSYILYYNDRHEEVKLDAVAKPSVLMDGKDYAVAVPPLLSFNLTHLSSFTNYTVRIKACVRELCSNLSQPLSVITNIGVPGQMDPPRTEVLNSSHVLVTWKPPEQSNGPVDLYLLHLYRQQGENLTVLDRLNVTGKSVLIPVDCPSELRSSEDGTHLFRIQAVNVQNQELLKGPLSAPTKTKLCYPGSDMDYPLIIGIVIGCTLALAFVILALYAAVRWMKTKVDMMKDIKVQLPSGLETPYSNAINSYEHFKKGLNGRGSDPNLSPKLGCGRMDSYSGLTENPADDSFKNRHGSGASHFSAASTDELLSRQSPGGQVTTAKTAAPTTKGDRNPSGDSSSGHDSISSSLTHRTIISSCDGSSASEEPHRHTKYPHTSRDSGLEEEGKASTPPCPSAPPPPNNLPASVYSKLGLLEGGCIPDYLPIPRGRHLNMHSNYLANSEPSITELPDDFHHDPPSPDVPYSKFGLSHSVTDLMLDNMESPDSLPNSQHSPQEAMPYSRFGLRRQQPYQKSPYIPVGMALLTGPQKDPNQLLASKMGPSLVLKTPTKKNKEVESVPDEAYSKLGLSLPLPEQNSPAKSKGYVTLEEIKFNEQNHSLPDLTISSRDGSPTLLESEQLQHADSPSRNGYLPHQLIAPVKISEPPVLPDVVNCSSVLPLPAMLQVTPEVKVQGNNGYVVLNQALAKNTNV